MKVFLHICAQTHICACVWGYALTLGRALWKFRAEELTISLDAGAHLRGQRLDWEVLSCTRHQTNWNNPKQPLRTYMVYFLMQLPCLCVYPLESALTGVSQSSCTTAFLVGRVQVKIQSHMSKELASGWLSII